jgi:mxaJ protein
VSAPVRVAVALLITIGLVCPGSASGQTGAGRAADPLTPFGIPKGQFRVCADPENMPFSNDRLEGFENRLATLIAKDFDAKPSYIWWGQRRGFIRNTMNATLQEGRCDFVLGVPDKYDLVSTTTPYYRSSYVFVSLKSKELTLRSLDDQVLKKLKIGVHLLGDDYTNPPPVHELGKRHIVDNVVGFSTFYSAENPPSAIIDAVVKGTVDVAIVWGPIAGYFARQQRVPLALVPVPSGPGDLPFAFDIAMGVKRGNAAAKARLEQILVNRRAEIAQILAEFGVPLVARPPRQKQADPRK